MMACSREGYEAKQEGGDSMNIDKFSKAIISSSTSRQWSSTSGFRNPRIVRVSRSFGGKDRHSKVCTIRGLRDRRIRLSVPTAIELYDLQEKLGLNQPSKVIDWLLEATKLDIDKLPPLQFPPSFSQFHQQNLFPFHQSSSSHELSLGPLYDPNSTFVGIQNLMAKSRFLDMDSMSRGKGTKEAEKGKWIKTNEEENHQDGGGGGEVGYSTQKFFPMETHHHHSAPLPGFLNNNVNAMMSYNNNNYHSEEPASSLSLSQFGSHHGLLFHSHQQQQQVDPHPSSSGNVLQFHQPSFPLSSGSQLLFGPSSTLSTPPSFVTNSVENNNNDPRQFNHFHFINSSSSSQVIPHPLIPFPSLVSRPFPPSFISKPLDSDNNNQPDHKGSARS